MIFIGGEQVDPAEEDHGLIASMFGRLPGEVKSARELGRFVGYESADSGKGRLRFFGIEADASTSIPEGLVSWELNGAQWIVRRAKDGHTVIAREEDIVWRWLDVPGPGPSGAIGEFSTRSRGFSLFANVCYDRGKKGFNDDVYLVEYDPSWPQQYQRMADWLRGRLGSDIVLGMEHFGSTAIPRMPAKPIIDILVRIPSFEKGKRRALPILNDPTWEYWWYSGHMVFFKRKEAMGERTCHIHMAPEGHEVWKGIAFRDYLRSHPEEAARYAELKRGLAEKHRGDRERYTKEKVSFVNEIHKKARSE
jgi:GrpB-like predicted nucleotidyltransferase (UPF0157 family)